MLIPHNQLDPATLQSLIEEFVSRDGTDYGLDEVPLATRVARVRQQLDTGQVLIWYDPDSESCTLLPREQRPID